MLVLEGLFQLVLFSILMDNIRKMGIVNKDYQSQDETLVPYEAWTGPQRRGKGDRLSFNDSKKLPTCGRDASQCLNLGRTECQALPLFAVFQDKNLAKQIVRKDIFESLSSNKSTKIESKTQEPEPKHFVKETVKLFVREAILGKVVSFEVPLEAISADLLIAATTVAGLPQDASAQLEYQSRVLPQDGTKVKELMLLEHSTVTLRPCKTLTGGSQQVNPEALDDSLNQNFLMSFNMMEPLEDENQEVEDAMKEAAEDAPEEVPRMTADAACAPLRATMLLSQSMMSGVAGLLNGYDSDQMEQISERQEYDSEDDEKNGQPSTETAEKSLKSKNTGTKQPIQVSKKLFSKPSGREMSLMMEKEEWLPEVPTKPNDILLQSLERHGTQGKKVVALRKFKQPGQNKIDTKEEIVYACQLEFYSLDQDGQAYKLEKTMPIDTPKISRLHQATYTDRQKEIFFFTQDSESNLKLSIIEEDDTITQHDISKDSELQQQITRHSFCFGVNISHPWAKVAWAIYMISDEDSRRYISHALHGQDSYIYDIEAKKSLVKLVQIWFTPYYIQPRSDATGCRRYFFQTKQTSQIISCVLDFKQAREQNKLIVIDMSHPSKDSQIYLLDCRELHAAYLDYNQVAWFWKAGDKQGFILEDHHTQKPNEFKMHVIEVIDHTNMRLVYEQEYEYGEGDIARRQFTQNCSQKIKEYLSSRRKKLIRAQRQHFDQFCKEISLADTYKRLLNTLLNKISEDRLNRRVFKVNEKFSKEEAAQEAFKRIFSALDLEQTFYAILLLSPSNAVKELRSMSGDQREFFFLVNSATSDKFITMLNNELKAVEEKDLSCLKRYLKAMLSHQSQLTNHEKKALLFEQSDPTTNTLLWKLLEPRVILELDLCSDESQKIQMLHNCDESQLLELLQNIKPQVKDDLESKLHELRVFQPSRSIEELEKEAKSSPTLESKPTVTMHEIERPGTQGKHKVVLRKIQQNQGFKVTADGQLEELSSQQCQIEFYTLSEDRTRYFLDQTTIFPDLKTTRLHQDTEYSQNEVFFLSEDENEKNWLNIIHEGSNSIKRLEFDLQLLHDNLRPHNYFFELEHEDEFYKVGWAGLQLFTDSKGNCYLLCRHTLQDDVVFIDLATKKPVIIIKDTVPFLIYVSPLEEEKDGFRWYTFIDRVENELYSCQINFEEARKRNEPLLITPTEPGSQNRIEVYKQYLFNMNYDDDCLTRPWQNGKKRGFIIQKIRPSRTYAVRVKGPQDMKLVFDKEYDFYDRDTVVHEFMRDPPCPKLTIEEQELHVDTDNPLICFYPDRASNSVTFGQLFLDSPNGQEVAQKREEVAQNLMQIEFPGTIYASGDFPTGLVIEEEVYVCSQCMFGFLTVDLDNKEAHIFEVSLRKPFVSQSFTQRAKWEVSSTRLEDEAFNFLKGMKDRRPKYSIFSRSDKEGNFVVLQSKSQLFLMSQSTVKIFNLNLVDVEAMINPKDKFSRILYTTCSASGQNHKILAHDLFNSTETPKLVLAETEGEIRLVTNSGEYFLVVNSSESLIKFQLNEESIVTKKHVISLAQIGRSLLSPDQILGVCFSDSVVVTAKSVISIATGHVTPNDIGDKIIFSDQNMIVVAEFLQKQGIKLHAISNPGNRQLRFGDENLIRNLLSAHQVSVNQLLLQFRRNKFIMQQTGWKIEKGQYWIMLSTDCQSKELPPDLDAILNAEDYFASSYTSKSGRLTLLLSSGSEQEIQKIALVEVTSDLRVASYRNYHLCPKPNLAIIGEQVIHNHQDDLVIVRQKPRNKDETAASENQQIEFKPAGESGSDNLASIIIEQDRFISRLSAVFAYAGKHICWTVPYSDDKSVKIFNTKTKVLREFHPSKFMDISDKGMNLCINTVDPLHLLTQGYATSPDRSSMRKLGEYLQVWNVTDDILMLDLNRAEPTPVAELGDPLPFADANNYIASGFRPSVYREESKRWEYLNQTRFGNIVLKSVELETADGGLQHRRLTIFKLHSRYDLILLKELKDEESEEDYVETQLLFASFDGQSILHELSQVLPGLNSVLEHMMLLELNASRDVEEQRFYENVLSRLHYAFNFRRLNFEADHTFSSNTVLSTLLDNPSFRDALLKIAKFIPSFSLMQHYTDQSSFKHIVDNPSDVTKECLDNCLIENAATVKITMVKWPKKTSFVTLMRSTPIVLEEELEQEILSTRDKNAKEKPVSVGIIDMSWFFRNGDSFATFSHYLQRMPNSYYASHFMACLFKQFWNQAQRTIIKLMMIPFLVFIITTSFYMQMEVVDDDQGRGNGWTAHNVIKKILGVISLLLLVNQILGEVRQLLGDGFIDYFKSSWNWIDILGLLTTLIFDVHTMSELSLISVQNLRVMAALASCALFIKLYDWLRLFKSTSFYVLLVKLTVKDILPFMTLFAVSLLIFGMPMNMLSHNRDDEETLVDDSFGYWLLDTIYNQYLISLGDAEQKDNFKKGMQTDLVLTFYLLAVSFMQVVMLNMLIAIMGDTFGNATELKEVNTIRSRLQILGDFAELIKQAPPIRGDSVYMVVITPVDEENDEDDWQGSVNQIARITKLQNDELEKRISKKTDKLEIGIKKQLDLNKSDIQKLLNDQESFKTEQEAIRNGQKAMQAQLSELKEILLKMNKPQ